MVSVYGNIGVSAMISLMIASDLYHFASSNGNRCQQIEHFPATATTPTTITHKQYKPFIGGYLMFAAN